jgi:hypothetical protein
MIHILWTIFLLNYTTIINEVFNSVPVPWRLDKDTVLGSVYHWITDPDPALFISGFQDAKKKISTSFFAY